MRHRTPPFPPTLRDDGRVADAVAAALDDAATVDGFGTDVHATLEWAVRVGASFDVRASIADTWTLLAATAARDVAAARIVEPHLDALGIIGEARAAGVGAGFTAPAGSSWGVFAAESGGVRLDARERDGTWSLRGTKPWCSLAAHLTHALVTAWVGADERRLFAVELRSPRVRARPGPWHARGLERIVSAPVDLDDVPAVPIGEAGWYLRRRGFARGGMGVAACWWGSALPLLEALRASAAREGADQLAAVHLGRADVALWAARTALVEAARDIDGGRAEPEALLGGRVRATVASSAEVALAEADHALGPLPLVSDGAHARRVADLHLYLRQHHADRDLGRLGRDLVAGEGDR